MTWNWQHPDWPNWYFDPTALEELERQFLLNAGRLQGAWTHLSKADQDLVTVELLSDEALKTSEIEGEFLDRDSVQSSIRRQFGLQGDKRAGPAESGIAELMVANHKSFETPLTHDILYNWHHLICRGRNDLNDLGSYRTHLDVMEVVSGPIGKRKVHFQAPPSSDIVSEMDAFLIWFNDQTLPALTKAGLAHLWFVCIHPFEDGNGRIARAISEKAISQILNGPSLLALSTQIRKQRKGYYDALESNNKQLEITPWLVWFAEAALKAQNYSQALLTHLISKTRVLDEWSDKLNTRQTKGIIRMFNAGPEGFKGGLSAKNYMAITSCSPATARRDLADLVTNGLLKRTGEKRGARYWLIDK